MLIGNDFFGQLFTLWDGDRRYLIVKNPACLAAWYLACDAAANLSASSRVMPYL